MGKAMLSDSLAYIKQFPQFIIYQLIPSASRPGKTDKQPVFPKTGYRCNGQDPANWMSYEAAEESATSARSKLNGDYRVGFVLTSQSKIFVLDVDDALCPDNQWHPLVGKLRAALPRAGVEISSSGRGLHNWGRYEGSEPTHGCSAIVEGVKLELYTSGRFIALGEQSTAVGEAGADCTAELHHLIGNYFPPDKSSALDEVWTSEPCEGWKGPSDDSELIERAMRPSATSVFGGKASVADLWLPNEQVLSANYPDSGGRSFDASAADAALAQHLAFWVGNNCERIRRLMLRSGLVRDKWGREDYLIRTILGAVSRQESVYNEQHHAEVAKRRQEQIAENIRIGEGSEQYPSSSVLTEAEMLARYVNVVEGKRVIDLEHPRRIFSLDEWKSAHKSSRAVLEDKRNFNLDGSNKTKSVETTKLWEMNPDRKQVDTVTFRPGFNPVTVDPEGKSAANTWRSIERGATAGDSSLFDLHVTYLFGADAPRFLDWLAHIEQRPGELPHTGWVHISPLQGTGRNWLSSVLCRLWRGYVASSFDLAGTLRTGFNGPLSQKLLAVVDEIDEGGANARWENAEVLKSLVTAEHRHINPKYGHQRLEYNACRWLIFSNHTSALPLTEKDRRFNVVRNDNPPMLPEYYARLYAALKDPAFIASVGWKLRTLDISAFNPGAHAVMNEAKLALVGSSRSDADDLIAHLVTEHTADVIANSTLGAMLTNQPFGKMTSHHRHALERAGVQPYGKSIRLGSSVTKVSILRNHSLWKTAEAHQIQAELNKAFGGFAKNIPNL
jgi:primase-polymerase (primpol)-like protein